MRRNATFELEAQLEAHIEAQIEAARVAALEVAHEVTREAPLTERRLETCCCAGGSVGDVCGRKHGIMRGSSSSASCRAKWSADARFVADALLRTRREAEELCVLVDAELVSLDDDAFLLDSHARVRKEKDIDNDKDTEDTSSALERAVVSLETATLEALEKASWKSARSERRAQAAVAWLTRGSSAHPALPEEKGEENGEDKSEDKGEKNNMTETVAAFEAWVFRAAKDFDAVALLAAAGHPWMQTVWLSRPVSDLWDAAFFSRAIADDWLLVLLDCVETQAQASEILFRVARYGASDAVVSALLALPPELLDLNAKAQLRKSSQVYYPRSYYPRWFDYGCPALSIAATCGRVSVLSALLALPPSRLDVNALSLDGDTALTLAVEVGCEASVDAILALPVGRFTAFNALSRWGKTALELATEHRHTRCALKLLMLPPQTLDARLRSVRGLRRTVLMTAAEQGCMPLVASLLARSPESQWINATDRKKDTALTLAAKHGHVAVVAALLALPPECGLDLNAKNSRGETAFFLAVRYARRRVVNALLALPPNRMLQTKTRTERGQDALGVLEGSPRRHTSWSEVLDELGSRRI